MPDPFNLQRFLDAQSKDYELALKEIRAGRKESHWIWYIFPQIAGLGQSENSIKFAIGSIDEASAYIDHPVLGPRLIECFQGLLAHNGQKARDLLGEIDAKKLKSCATLFRRVLPAGSEADQILDQFYFGVLDPETEGRLNRSQW